MPKGKYVNHKGKSRHFTNPEELKHEKETDESEESASGEESGSDESDDPNAKAKGVSKLIEVHNLNRAAKKLENKISTLDLGESTTAPASSSSTSAKPELSRREREEIAKQQARANYQKLHAQGKTHEARADLARLAIIKQQRAEAAAKREAEKKLKEAKANATKQ